ncbi:MAG: glycosyltransferase family 39 protein [Candidatus Schekmanbacteria bacterium]|nr:glycosyltransferase family 39 protein [Candidatus Schekmanbacteria bacterium]
MDKKTALPSSVIKTVLFVLINCIIVLSSVLIAKKIRVNPSYHADEFIIITLSVYYPVIWSLLVKNFKSDINGFFRWTVFLPTALSLSLSTSFLSLFKIFIPLSVCLSYFLILISILFLISVFITVKPKHMTETERTFFFQSLILLASGICFIISDKIINKLSSAFTINRINEIIMLSGMFFFSLFIANSIPALLKDIFTSGKRTLSKPWIIPVFLSIYVIIPVAIFFKVLGGIPHVQDEIAYLFQAKIFASGRLFTDAPPVQKFFDYEFIIIDGVKWYGKYFFGFPLLLAIGLLLKTPWIVNPLLGAGAVFLFYQILKKFLGEECLSSYMLVLPLFSPFILFINASYLSHTSSLFFLTLFIYLFFKAIEKHSIVLSMLCGLSLGFAYNIRPLTAVTFTSPFLVYGTYLLFRKKIKITQVIIFSIAVILLMVGYFSYNYMLTDDIFLTPFNKYCPTDHLGFGKDIGLPYLSEYGHDFADGWQNTRDNLRELSSDLLGFPKISFLLVIVPFLIGGTTLFEKFFLGAFVINIAGYFCYYFNGIAYGPRYYFETVFFLLFLFLKGLIRVKEFVTKKLSGKNIMASQESAQFIIPLIFILLLLRTCIVSIPEKVQIYGNRFWNLDNTLEHTMANSGLHNAVVFIRSGYFREREAAPNYYGAGFIKNSLKLDNDIVYARDFGDEEDLNLMKHFPGRRPYRFVFNESLITANRYYADNLSPYLYPIPKPEVAYSSNINIIP